MTTARTVLLAVCGFGLVLGAGFGTATAQPYRLMDRGTGFQSNPRGFQNQLGGVEHRQGLPAGSTDARRDQNIQSVPPATQPLNR